MRHLFIALLLLAQSLPALALSYGNVYFFGDSLTDVGNVQNTYAAIPHPPGAPAVVPGAPYDSQGRFSNGPIYADVLAAGLGHAATPSTFGGNDYAYGGARTRYQVFGPPFLGIIDQVTAFRSLAGPADAGALYVVWGGANNLQDLIAGTSTDVLGNPIPDLGATVSDIAASILGLYSEGARSFLVPNVPDLALVPRILEAGPAAQAFAHFLSVTFNSLLAGAIGELEAATPGLDITYFDTFGALNDLLLDAASLGIGNTTDRCYTGDDLGFAGGGTVCADPDSYLFWDGIHPTSVVHQILGREMLAALMVPEPASLALVALALLALGGTAQRRRPDVKPEHPLRDGPWVAAPAG